MSSSLLVETVLDIYDTTREKPLAQAVGLIVRKIDSYEQSTPKPARVDIEFVEKMAEQILGHRLSNKPRHRR